MRARSVHPLAHYCLGPRRLVGTGGTITCLVAIHKKLAEFDPQKIDHTSLTIEQVRELLLHGFTEPDAGRNSASQCRGCRTSAPT